MALLWDAPLQDVEVDEYEVYLADGSRVLTVSRSLVSCRLDGICFGEPVAEPISVFGLAVSVGGGLGLDHHVLTYARRLSHGCLR